jgi:hypothetical protein
MIAYNVKKPVINEFERMWLNLRYNTDVYLEAPSKIMGNSVTIMDDLTNIELGTSRLKVSSFAS